ncbi:MAG TPA: hypothetical protein VLV31_10295 [Candidatus Acidoferrales bacterium]|nr:hypothetical protein [Candidatus Acidoferrales bacterium]
MPVRRIVALLVLGLMIREAFSFWTGHPFDFELWVRLGYAVNHGGDPYGILPPAPGLSFANLFSSDSTPTIAYLPFWPLLTGLMYATYSMIGLNDRFLYYFLLKQPVIIGDVTLAYLLYSYISSRKPGASGAWVILFWLFSPFTIMLSGVWGMFDSIAICFIILSASAVSRVKSGLWAGLGVFAKSVPIIFVTPLTLRNIRNGKSIVAIVVALTLPLSLSAAVFLVMRWPVTLVNSTIASTAGKGGWSMSIWDVFFYVNSLGWLPSSAPLLYGALGLVWIPALLVFTWVAIRRFRTDTDEGLFQALLVCALIFLIFKARVTEQYALYLLALAAIDVALWNPQRKTLLTLTTIVAIIYLVVNNYFLIRFLSPIYPGYVNFENAMIAPFSNLITIFHVIAGTAFTVLNVKYLLNLLGGRRSSLRPV